MHAYRDSLCHLLHDTPPCEMRVKNACFKSSEIVFVMVFVLHMTVLCGCLCAQSSDELLLAAYTVWIRVGHFDKQ